jgi:tetratricopeptide (TPR) repeat protein
MNNEIMKLKKNKILLVFLGALVLLIIDLALMYSLGLLPLLKAPKSLKANINTHNQVKQPPEVNFMKLKSGDLPADQYKIYTSAIAQLKKDATDRASLFNLGYVYRKIGKLDEAVKAFNYFLQNADPLDPEFLLGLARVQTDQKQYQAAEASYYKITQSFPLYMTAYHELLALYLNKFLAPNYKFVTELNRAKTYDAKNEYINEIGQLLGDYNSQIGAQGK